MRTSILADAEKAIEATYLSELGKLRSILEKEKHIQQQLSLLDGQLAQLNSPKHARADYLCLGTDMLWRAWENRMRQALNMELARARASKLAAVDEVRQSLGRREAMGALVAEARKNLRDNQRQRQHESLCQTKLLSQTD